MAGNQFRNDDDREQITNLLNSKMGKRVLIGIVVVVVVWFVVQSAWTAF